MFITTKLVVLKNISIKDLMDNISFVFQDSDLVTDTVFNNIAMAKKGATKEEVIRAAQKARCHDFIKQLPHGYETRLGKETYLSGGEKQRIAVARAILKYSPILVLDEATSALDNESEHFIQQAFDEAMQDRTTIVIAHRLSTIENADRIVVMYRGQIVEQGTHQELLAKHGAYYQLHQRNFEEN